MTYDTIREAAEDRVTGDSRGAWALADALLAEIPDALGRNQYAEASSDVATSLRDIADRLDADGVETPAGNRYEMATLRELRLVAMSWPPESRFREAAFRTHQEAGAKHKGDSLKRAVFTGLCLAARHKRWDKPDDLAVDELAWEAAASAIRARVAKRNRYPVAANDLRVAYKLKTNLPEKDQDVRTATIVDVIGSMMNVNRDMAFIVQVLSRDDLVIPDHGRKSLAGHGQRLHAAIDLFDSVLNDGGISDDSIANFINQEQL